VGRTKILCNTCLVIISDADENLFGLSKLKVNMRLKDNSMENYLTKLVVLLLSITEISGVTRIWTVGELSWLNSVR
jgi:hypothetical protein